MFYNNLASQGQEKNNSHYNLQHLEKFRASLHGILYFDNLGGLQYKTKQKCIGRPDFNFGTCGDGGGLRICKLVIVDNGEETKQAYSWWRIKKKNNLRWWMI